MASSNQGAFLIVTVLVDSAARAAAVTRSHGDALERAVQASAADEVAGMDLCELPISTHAFAALRRALGLPPTTVAVYDLFPLSPDLASGLRQIAGQFLAAEALWALEGQGLLDGQPAGERFSLPKGWTKSPQEIREKLVEAGATNLSTDAVMAFASIKQRWDELGSK